MRAAHGTRGRHVTYAMCGVPGMPGMFNPDIGASCNSVSNLVTASARDQQLLPMTQRKSEYNGTESASKKFRNRSAALEKNGCARLLCPRLLDTRAAVSVSVPQEQFSL